MLNELGYEVLLANGGKEAIRVFDENKDRIKLLILDMIMPDLGGDVVYDRIKAVRPDIPVILSSGYSIEGQAEAILNMRLRALNKLQEIELKAEHDELSKERDELQKLINLVDF